MCRYWFMNVGYTVRLMTGMMVVNFIRTRRQGRGTHHYI